MTQHRPPSRVLAQAARRFADGHSDRWAEIPRDRLLILSVTAVNPTGSPGGNAVITLTWRGRDVQAADYCASYTTPTVGDRVICVLVSDQLVVLDRLAG